MYCNLDLYTPFQIKLSEAKKVTSLNNQVFILDEKKINQNQMKKYLKETKKKLHKSNY